MNAHERNSHMMRVLARERGLVLRLFKSSRYRNHGAVALGFEILLGPFDDEDRRVATFFHELGHDMIPEGKWVALQRLPPTQGKRKEEGLAWEYGLEAAYRQEYLFSPETLRWCRARLEWYFGRAKLPERFAKLFDPEGKYVKEEGFTLGGLKEIERALDA